MANTERVKRKHESTDMSPGRHEKKKKRKHKSIEDDDQGLKRVEDKSEKKVIVSNLFEADKITNTERVKRKHESTDMAQGEHEKKKKRKHKSKDEDDRGLKRIKEKSEHKVMYKDTSSDLSETKHSKETTKDQETGAQQENDTKQEQPKKKKKKIHLSKKNYLKKKIKTKQQKKKVAAGNDVDTTNEDKQSGKDSALEYLQQWDDDRTAWKFMKVRQVWLLQHMYEEDQVDESNFETLLKYLEPLKGKARETTVKEAEEVIQSAEMADEGEATKADRARRIIQLYPE